MSVFSSSFLRLRPWFLLVHYSFGMWNPTEIQSSRQPDFDTAWEEAWQFSGSPRVRAAKVLLLNFSDVVQAQSLQVEERTTPSFIGNCWTQEVPSLYQHTVKLCIWGPNLCSFWHKVHLPITVGQSFINLTTLNIFLSFKALHLCHYLYKLRLPFTVMI